jgi:hypothetical protein
MHVQEQYKQNESEDAHQLPAAPHVSAVAQVDSHKHNSRGMKEADEQLIHN